MGLRNEEEEDVVVGAEGGGTGLGLGAIEMRSQVGEERVDVAGGFGVGERRSYMAQTGKEVETSGSRRTS